MPGTSGPAMVAAARAAGISTPVVFMTGHVDPEFVSDDALGAPVLRKPFLAADLLDAVARTFAEPPAGPTPARQPRSEPDSATAGPNQRI